MSIKITNAGSLSTIQDLGRKGKMDFGFSQSGAMDVNSAILANILVDNDVNAAVIEMTFNGITAIINDDCYIAVTGGDCMPMVNNRPIPMNTTVKLNSGQILRCPQCINGLRCYLAINGGFNVPMIMGSASTNLKCKIGGYQGRKLEVGDVIEVNKKIQVCAIKSTPYFLYKNSVSLRAILGPQDEMFTLDGINTLLSEEYTVSSSSDRMGMRLNGKAIESINGYDIISDATSLGSIQIPPSGEPIILLADRQTTGGYAKIASIISVDIPLLAQLKAGDKIKFEKIDVLSAQKIMKEESKRFDAFVSTLSRR